MTRYLAITTCNKEQWQQFGRRMAATFCEHWPRDLALVMYAERFDPSGDLPLEVVNLEIAAPWQPLFEQLYSAPQYNGGSNGRDYRRDAVRFSHKVAAIGHAADTYDCDVLIWIDADVVTHAPVTTEWLNSLFPEPATIAWLDRDNCYPECGFVMFRMPAARKLIRTVVGSYRGGAIFELPETHDSYVIQHVARRMGVKAHSLSGAEGRKAVGHPWCASELASRMDHLKGEVRKGRGKSLPQDLKVPRPEAYWQ